jgi:hypothetical protein
MLPTMFRFIWPNGYRREEFLKLANQKQESPMVAMFINESGRNEQWGPSIDASYQVSVHLAEGVLEAYLSVIQFIANCIWLIWLIFLESIPS